MGSVVKTLVLILRISKKKKKTEQKRNQGKNAKEQPVISASVSVPHIVVMGEGGGVRAGAAARSGWPTYFPFTSRVASPWNFQQFCFAPLHMWQKKKKDTDLWESSPGSALPDGSQESSIQPCEG